MNEIAIDYQAEYDRLRALNHDLSEQAAALTQKNEAMAAHIECLSNTIRSLERDNAIMRGQLDVVNLIFGGNS